MILGNEYNFNIGFSAHTIKVTEIADTAIDNDYAVISVKSTSKEYTLYLNQPALIDADNDGTLDLEATLTKIFGGNQLVSISFKGISIKVPEAQPIDDESSSTIAATAADDSAMPIEPEPETTQGEEPSTGVKRKVNGVYIVIIIGMVSTVIAGIFIWKRKTKPVL